MIERKIRIHVPVGLLALLFCCAISAPADAAGTGPTTPLAPALTISAGSAKISGSAIKGSVTFHNAGDDGTGRFYFTLVATSGGGNRLLKRAHEPDLAPSNSKSVGFSAKLPGDLTAGSHPIWACAASSSKPPAPLKKNGCRRLGAVNVPQPSTSGSGGAPSTTPAAPSQAPSSPPAPSPLPPAPISTVPTAPLAFTAQEPFVVNDANNGYYWADVPAAYDATNQTPTPLLVWLHGCGGESSGDIYTVSPETVSGTGRPRDWISIAVGGRDDDCWDVNDDGPAVQAAIADVESHFNIDRHRVILGGYSSGGDLSYRLAFYSGDEFAGVLAENTSPFRDTGSSEAQSLAAAAYKFHVVHLAHLQDTEYPIAGVRQETDAMIADGFPLQRIEVDGDHFDEPGATVNGHPVPGTDADLITYLLPHIDDGWTSP